MTAEHPTGAPRDTCLAGGTTHAWESRGLDSNVKAELVNVRRCVWCGRWQEKPYGAGARRGWRNHADRIDGTP